MKQITANSFLDTLKESLSFVFFFFFKYHIFFIPNEIASSKNKVAYPPLQFPNPISRVFSFKALIVIIFVT